MLWNIIPSICQYYHYTEFFIYFYVKWHVVVKAREVSKWDMKMMRIGSGKTRSGPLLSTSFCRNIVKGGYFFSFFSPPLPLEKQDGSNKHINRQMNSTFQYEHKRQKIPEKKFHCSSCLFPVLYGSSAFYYFLGKFFNKEQKQEIVAQKRNLLPVSHIIFLTNIQSLRT